VWDCAEGGDWVFQLLIALKGERGSSVPATLGTLGARGILLAAVCCGRSEGEGVDGRLLCVSAVGCDVC
jgi:hypothetical protein